jgi:subtilisin family serine protease
MNIFIFSLVVIGYVFAIAPLHIAQNAIKDQYIVVFKSHITEEQKNLHLSKRNESIIFTYEIGTFKGYSAKMDKTLLASTLQAEEVAWIEQDQIATAYDACVKQSDAVWGLDRVSERELLLDGNFVYSQSSGSGVDVYVIDTGIYTAHNEFEGRAVWGANFVDSQNNDCNGHGTHVAGTIGGKVYGVAKKTTLVAVKVLGCSGSGSYTGVIKGVEYATQQYNKNKRPSVANMSLGGGISAALDAAIAASVQAGVVYAVAAGNSDANACNFSPARVPEAITVGATTVEEEGGVEKDTRSYFSNFGPCVKILAPGQLIKSAWIGSPTATNTISGTSMASPHVAGVISLYLSENPTKTPTEVRNYILSLATSNMIDMDCAGDAVCSATPNKLAFTACA